jgi:hypothetical protein
MQLHFLKQSELSSKATESKTGMKNISKKFRVEK